MSAEPRLSSARQPSHRLVPNLIVQPDTVEQIDRRSGSRTNYLRTTLGPRGNQHPPTTPAYHVAAECGFDSCALPCTARVAASID